MPYEFFISYTRANNDIYLKQFVDELREEVRQKLGYSINIGFFDQDDIELGAEWDPVLVQALQECKVLVSICSPAYFEKPYCGKEWQFFQLRRALYAQQNNAALPEVIKPVLWIPQPAGKPLPPGIGTTQYTFGNPHAEIFQRGLRFIVKQKQKDEYQTIYNNFLEELSTKISDEIQGFQGLKLLPQLTPTPNLSDVPSAFHPAGQAPAQAATAPVVTQKNSGPRYVKFVYVAGQPDEVKNLKNQVDAYREFGASDWKPFLAAGRNRRIGALAPHVATGEDLDFSPDEVPFSKDLVNEIKKARDDHNLVVLLVDCWTAGHPDYQAILQDFDQQNYQNCSVIILWDELDPETAQQEKLLRDNLRTIFKFRRLMNNSPFYRDSIRTEDELRKQLSDVLTSLRAEIINNRNFQITRPIPLGTEKPIINNGPTSGG